MKWGHQSMVWMQKGHRGLTGSQFSFTKTVGLGLGRTSRRLWRSSMIVLERWIASTGRLIHCCPRHPELSGWATSGPSHCLISFISSSPRCLPTDLESPWGPSNRLLFRGGRWRIVLSLQRRSSLLGKGREPPASYERWISPKRNDSLDWRFLWNVLKRHGFPEAWTNWMKHCVCTTTFAVLINGRP